MCPSPHELLYDSEASLRLVDAALREFQESRGAQGEQENLTTPADEPATLTRALYESRAELRTMLGCLRSHRFSAAADPLPASWTAILDETERRLAKLIRTLEGMPEP